MCLLHAEKIERSEALATEGDADGSIAMNEAAMALREEHDKLRHDLITPERTKSVCEVCGVFVNSNDTEQRREVRHAFLQLFWASCHCQEMGQVLLRPIFVWCRTAHA